MTARARRRARRAAFTLVELLVAVAVMAMICMLIYGAFASMSRSKDGVRRVSDRYHEGRQALQRIARELQSAYISQHRPLDDRLVVVHTAFIGTRRSPADRVDFNSFANRRLDRDARESDQAEISYFGLPDPKQPGVLDLVRRIDKMPDLEPDRGGRVDVLATDIDLFQLEYLEPMTGSWVESWDTTQATGQPNRLPLQVKVTLVLNGGRRGRAGRARSTVPLVTKIAMPMQQALTFAIQ